MSGKLPEGGGDCNFVAETWQFGPTQAIVLTGEHTRHYIPGPMRSRIGRSIIATRAKVSAMHPSVRARRIIYRIHFAKSISSRFIGDFHYLRH